MSGIKSSDYYTYGPYPRRQCGKCMLPDVDCGCPEMMGMVPPEPPVDVAQELIDHIAHFDDNVIETVRKELNSWRATDFEPVKPHINFRLSPVRDWFLSQLICDPKEQ